MSSSDLSSTPKTGMLHHVEINVSSLEVSLRFWQPLLLMLGYTQHRAGGACTPSIPLLGPAGIMSRAASETVDPARLWQEGTSWLINMRISVYSDFRMS
jgi:hypothetical protein